MISDAQAQAIFDEEGAAPCPGVAVEQHWYPDAAGTPRPLWLWRPVESAAAPRPVMLYAHGGGFVGGDPSGAGNLAKYLALTLGYVTAAPAYRLATPSQASFPHAVLDLQAARRWIAQRCGELHGDVSRIVLAGESAGASLAALAVLGVGTPVGDPPPRPAALVAYWGALDFVARWFDRGENAGAEREFLGCTYAENPTRYHQASPLTHVRPELPPALFAYGRQDTIVHPRQGALAGAAWQAHGNHAELYIHGNLGHGVAGDNRTVRETLFAQTRDFLAARLAPERDPSLPR